MRKSVTKLLSSITRQRRRLLRSGALIGARLASRPVAPSAFDYAPVFDHLDAELAAAQCSVHAAEANWSLGQSEVDERREDRDRAFARLRDLHAPVPRLLRHLKVPMPPSGTAASPEALACQVARTVYVLRRLEPEPPAPVGGVSLDPGPLAEQLETHSRRLEDQLRALSLAESQLKVSRPKADDAFASAGRVLSWVSRTIESLEGLSQET